MCFVISHHCTINIFIIVIFKYLNLHLQKTFISCLLLRMGLKEEMLQTLFAVNNINIRVFPAQKSFTYVTSFITILVFKVNSRQQEEAIKVQN